MLFLGFISLISDSQNESYGPPQCMDGEKYHTSYSLKSKTLEVSISDEVAMGSVESVETMDRNGLKEIELDKDDEKEGNCLEHEGRGRKRSSKASPSIPPKQKGNGRLDLGIRSAGEYD